VNFGPVTPEFTGLICVPACLKIGLPAFIRRAAGLEDGSADWHVNSADDLSTYDDNLLSFCPVIPEFTRLNCIQQASISTQVSLTAFVRGVTLLGTAVINAQFVS